MAIINNQPTGYTAAWVIWWIILQRKTVPAVNSLDWLERRREWPNWIFKQTHLNNSNKMDKLNYFYKYARYA